MEFRTLFQGKKTDASMTSRPVIRFLARIPNLVLSPIIKDNRHQPPLPPADKTRPDAPNFLLAHSGVSWDVTGQLDHEKSLLESSETIKLVLDNSGHGFWDWHIATDNVHRDENWYRITGFSPQDIKSPRGAWVKRIHPDDRDQILGRIDEYLATGGNPLELDYRFYRKNGEMIWLHSRGRIVAYDPHGRPVRMMGTIEDTTARKEGMLSLEGSQRHLKSILQAAPIGMVIANSGGEISEVNEAFTQILGYSQDELMGSQFCELMFPSDLPRYLSGIDQLRLGEFENYRDEWRLLDKKGTFIWLNISIVLVREEAEADAYFIIQIQDITARKQAETRLYESQQTLQNAFQNSPIGMCLVSTAGSFISTNEAMCAMLGYSEKELLALSFQEITHPDDLEDGINRVNQLLEGKANSFRVEKRYLRKDGHIVWTILSVSLVRSQEGKPAYFISQIQDITDYKLAEIALLNSQRRYQQLFEEAPIMYVVSVDQDNLPYISDCNTFFLRKLGYTREEVINRPITDFLSASSTRILREESYKKALQGEMKDPVYRQLVKKSGEILETILQVVPTLDENGVPIGTLAMYLDISSQTRSEKFMETILNNNLQSTILFSVNGRVLLYNQEAARQVADLFGRTLRQGSHIIGALPADLVDIFRKSFEKVLAEKAVIAEDWCYRRGEEETWLQLSYVPVFSPENEIEVVSFSAHEVTHRKHLEEALRAAKNQAEAANRAKSAFLANMSHELRTPLNAILGFSQLMAQDNKFTAAQKINLETINSSGEHLLSLINNILELSKIEAGRINIAAEPFDLHWLLASVQQMFSLQADEKGVDLCFNFERIPRSLIGDELKLRQMLINLLGNALKFTPQGTVSLTVDLISRPGDQIWLRFTVCDTGPGINDKEMHLLFKPFSQTTTGIALQRGTGLGLAIVNQYSQLLGGQLTVTSSVAAGSSGTQFALELPFARAETGLLRPKRPLIKKTPKLAAGQQTRRLLIADDNRVNRALLAAMLQPLGLEVREASTGLEAISLWEKWRPDLIFMDIRMPDLNGYEAIRQIRQMPGGEKTVIITVTASALDNSPAQALAEGADGYLPKPFNIHEIYHVLESFMDLKFVFEEDKSASKIPPPSPVSRPVDKQVVDQVWAGQMRQTIARGDYREIISLIDQLSVDAPIPVGKLRTLADQFEYDAMLKLLGEGSDG